MDIHLSRLFFQLCQSVRVLALPRPWSCCWLYGVLDWCDGWSRELITTCSAGGNRVGDIALVESADEIIKWREEKSNEANDAKPLWLN